MYLLTSSNIKISHDFHHWPSKSQTLLLGQPRWSESSSPMMQPTFTFVKHQSACYTRPFSVRIVRQLCKVLHQSPRQTTPLFSAVCTHRAMAVEPVWTRAPGSAKDAKHLTAHQYSPVSSRIRDVLRSSSGFMKHSRNGYSLAPRWICFSPEELPTSRREF